MTYRKCFIDSCHSVVRSIGVGPYCYFHSCSSIECSNYKDCEIHKCQIPFCGESNEYNKSFCYRHACKAFNCKRSIPCESHTCSHKYSEIEYFPWREQFCTQLSMKPGTYCNEHTCNVNGCENNHLCEIHRCRYVCCRQKTSSENIYYCHRHRCGYEGCVNTIGKCPIHSCPIGNCENHRVPGWKRCWTHLTHTDVFVATDYAKVFPRDIIGIIRKYLL